MNCFKVIGLDVIVLACDVHQAKWIYERGHATADVTVRTDQLTVTPTPLDMKAHMWPPGVLLPTNAGWAYSYVAHVAYL